MKPEHNIETLDTTVPSHSVDNLMTRLSMHAQGQMWRKIETLTRVQGIAQDVTSKTYYGFSYFSLKGTGATIKIKCPTNSLPSEGQHIVIEGMPILKVNRFKSGLDVELEGSPVAQLAPIEYVDEIIEINKDRHIKLVQLLEEISLNQFALLGTEVALRDVASQLDPSIYNQFQKKVIVVSDKERILEDIGALPSTIAGYAIVRGGADDSLKIWDDAKFVKKIVELNVPFYVALGHAHQVGLIAQYADESFSTPTALGIAVKDIFERAYRLNHAENEIDRLNKNLELQATDLARRYQKQAKTENEKNKAELINLKKESEAKFETASKEYEAKLVNATKSQEAKIEEITKANQQETARLNTENQQQLAKLAQLHQDQIDKLNADNTAQRETELKARDTLSAQFQEQLKAVHADKDQRIETLVKNNRDEAEKERKQHAETLAKLNAEKNELAIEIGTQTHKRPLYEWGILFALILTIAFLLIR